MEPLRTLLLGKEKPMSIQVMAGDNANIYTYRAIIITT
jgi:hypothetical protein